MLLAREAMVFRPSSNDRYSVGRPIEDALGSSAASDGCAAAATAAALAAAAAATASTAALASELTMAGVGDGAKTTSCKESSAGELAGSKWEP
jgi:hypothetical protein